jgi:predicted O-methyltransferase YrrM
MNDTDTFLSELEAFGADAGTDTNAAHADRTRRMLNLARETGQLLAVLIRTRGARRILEIGSSNGYSTLWLASAAQALNGRVRTVESVQAKYELATANFARSPLQGCIDPVLADATEVLAQSPDATVDFLFLDSDRSRYMDWWPDIARVLGPGGVLVVDNATSHYSEMAAFLDTVAADPCFTNCLVPAVKAR